MYLLVKANFAYIKFLLNKYGVKHTVVCFFPFNFYRKSRLNNIFIAIFNDYGLKKKNELLCLNCKYITDKILNIPDKRSFKCLPLWSRFGNQNEKTIFKVYGKWQYLTIKLSFVILCKVQVRSLVASPINQRDAHEFSLSYFG